MLNWIVWNKTDHLTECKRITDVQELCPPLHLSVVDIEKGAFRSQPNFTLQYSEPFNSVQKNELRLVSKGYQQNDIFNIYVEKIWH